MELDITPPVKLNDTSYGFTVVLDHGAAIIPGFRIYMGKIQAPMQKIKSGWYPRLYLEYQAALDLYHAVKNECHGQYILLPLEKATAELVYNEALLDKFKIELSTL